MIWIADECGVFGVDRRDDGEVVLELEEVLLGAGDGVVEWIVQGRIIRPKGEFVDSMSEIECY